MLHNQLSLNNLNLELTQNNHFVCAHHLGTRSTNYCFTDTFFSSFQLVESYSYERRFETSSGVHSASDIDNVHTILEKAQLETISTSSSNEPRSDSSNSISLNEQPMSLTTVRF